MGMDMLDAPTPAPLPDRPELDGPVKKTPGRPAISADQRALNDQKYAQMMEFMQELPEDAREYRFGVFDARRKVDQKKSFVPLEKILLSEFKERGFKERGVFASYLLDKHGPGRYFIEPLDAHNHRIDRVASWVVTAGDPDMDEDDEYDDDLDDDDRPRQRRGRSRRRERFDDASLDDPIEQRANLSDLLVTQSRVAQGSAAQTAKSSGDMMTMLMFTNTQQAEARAAEERRREEQRAEERRREEMRAEERRREQVEERRREDEKAEVRRREERDREERQRKEEAEERRREDDRRNRDHLAAIEASNKKTELFLGGLSALAPVLLKVIEKKDDPIAAVLLRSVTDKREDPVQLMLLKSILDKAERKDGTEVMFQQMAQMSKMTTEMTAEQMKGVMSISTDMNREVLKKAMDMMMSSPQGQTEEGKSTIERVMGALSSAAEIVKTLVPASPQAQQLPQRRGLPHQARVTVQQPQQQAIQAPSQQPPTEAPTDPVAQLTPEQQQAIQDAPRGVPAVLGCLMAVHGSQFTNQGEHQKIVAYMLQQMPVDLRMAVLENNTAVVFGLCRPFIDADPDIKAWAESDGVVAWLLGYVPQLVPHILSMHGPIEQQRAELQAAIQAHEQAMAEAQVQQPAPTETVQAPAAPEAAPTPQDAVAPETAPAQSDVPAEPAAPPVPAEGAVETVAAASGGHLDPDDPG